MRPADPGALLNVEAAGKAAVDFDDIFYRYARMVHGFGKGRRILGYADDLAAFVYENDIQRDMGVSHPESLGFNCAEYKKHAVEWRHLFAVH